MPIEQIASLIEAIAKQKDHAQALRDLEEVEKGIRYARKVIIRKVYREAYPKQKTVEQITKDVFVDG